MSSAARAKLDACIALLREGKLTEADLRGLLDSPSSDGRRQDLLYLQTRGTSPDSPAIGISLFCAGRIETLSHDPNQWPYQNVLAAIADGWRVISFPNLALMMDDKTTYGLGCEFILEKWS